MKIIKQVTAVAAVAAALGTVSANAGTEPDHCYDFSNMVEDRSFTVGDTIETDFATINIRPYYVNGEPATADVRGAERASSQIAGGTAPELQVKLVALNVVPRKPVSAVSTRIAQNISSDGGFAESGIGVNRKARKSDKGFAGMDGAVIGTNAAGKARITADISPTGGGNWHSGTLTFEAVQGSIESIRLGGHTWNIDNMCFRY